MVPTPYQGDHSAKPLALDGKRRFWVIASPELGIKHPKKLPLLKISSR